MEAKDIIINSLVICLFSVSLLYFIVISIQNNNPASDLLNDKIINNTLNRMNTTLRSSYPSTDTQINASLKEVAESGTDSIITKSIVGSWKTLTGLLSGTVNTILNTLTEILNIPFIAITTILSIVGIIIIFIAWRLYRQGA